jgi:plastocyanin
LRFNKGLQIIGLFFIIVSLIAVVYASKTIMNRYNDITFVSSDTTSTSPFISPNATQTSQLVQLNHMQSNNIKKTSNNHNQYDVILPSGDGMPGYRTTYFTPTSLHIHAGDTVRWINKDAVSHTVTAVAFNSGLIWPNGSIYGQSTYAHTFNIPGIYVYFCEIHPYMGGIVYVDSEETQREITSTNPSGGNYIDVKVEIPQNAAYDANYGPMFIPSGAHVPFGSQVTFTNRDYVAHTATATDGTFDTGTLQPGESKSFFLNDRQGTITYFCRIHPWMQAIITVDPASSTTNIQKVSQQ